MTLHAKTELTWPRCVCGHIAQDHNVATVDPNVFGCDRCRPSEDKVCRAYRFPADFPQEKRDALNAQRSRILQGLDERKVPSEMDITLKLRVRFSDYNDYHDLAAKDEVTPEEVERFLDSLNMTLQDLCDVTQETSDDKFIYEYLAAEVLYKKEKHEGSQSD